MLGICTCYRSWSQVFSTWSIFFACSLFSPFSVVSNSCFIGSGRFSLMTEFLSFSNATWRQVLHNDLQSCRLLHFLFHLSALGDLWLSLHGALLVIGKVVGWSGGVPKGLPSGEFRWFPWLFLEGVFSKAITCDFFHVWCILGSFWMPKSMPKSIFHLFQQMFFQMRFSIDFWSFFGGSKPEK